MTGRVDATSYLKLSHAFVANMTGNIVFLGFGIAGAGGVSVWGSVTALGSFLVGGMVGGRIGARAARNRASATSRSRRRRSSRSLARARRTPPSGNGTPTIWAEFQVSIHAHAVDLQRCRRPSTMQPRSQAVLLSAWRKPHRDLMISPAEFDEVAAELGRTLDFVKVPEGEKEEVLAAFAAHKGEVTWGYF